MAPLLLGGIMEEYTGYREILVEDEFLSKFYSGEITPETFCLKNNEYLILINDEGEAIDHYCNSNGVLRRVPYPVISNNFTGEMKPRNPQQYCALDLLKNDEVPVKLLTGRFGTGKTMACVKAALQAIEEGKFEKIVFVRNNVQVKDTDNLGALPGDVDNKMLPYLLPFADHCGGIEGVKRLVEVGILEVVPLAYLRGRSIRNAIIYSMESENLTKEHIQLIIGRADEGTQVWFDGDLKQRDKGIFEKSQGLEKMIERLQDNKLFGYVHMPKVERSPIAALADELDD